MAPKAKFIFTPRTLISLNDLVMVYEDRSGEDGCAIHCDLVMFVNLLTLMLTVDPRDRIRASDILQHPFLTMSHLNGSFSNSYYVKSSRELLSICQNQDQFDKGDNVTLTTQQMNLGQETWTNTSSLSSRSSLPKTRGDMPVFQSIITRAARKMKRSTEHETLRKRQRDDVDNCKT
ncbi:homeodomain-interacting protein kinase 2-like [Cynoglossus semilaevis]|uniref:homeodomain-interacting protein kinase 2-like n=1 Tax=Cynoglossus semilaevis TaxID=244447 RepID=UPI0004985E95|nr:homeodomain-interacting protein kinase 2-like [Cynoglossus semilaevis]